MEINITKKRAVNLDLLRIVSMMLIILLHSVDHSGVLEASAQASFSMQLYVRTIYMFTQVCVNCFVLISGYFLVQSAFHLSKLVALWLEVVFYSLALRILFVVIGIKPFSLTSIVSCIFPILTGRYWFITIYFGLYLLSPFLKTAVRAMSKKQHTALNMLLFGLFSLWNSIHPSLAGMNSGGGWGLAWFVVLYLAAAWFRNYYQPNGRWIGKLLLWFGISLLTALGWLLLGGIHPLFRLIIGHWYHYNSAPAYLASLVFFAAFLNMKSSFGKIGKMICAAAPATFGVYLIHAHADVSPWLWGRLGLPRFMRSGYFPFVQLGAVLCIFVCCTLIDILRKKTVGIIENSRGIFAVCEKIMAFFSSVA